MALVDDYEAALFDLDGVVYLGPEPVEGAPGAVAALKERGTTVGFVTNNAARGPEVVVDQLNGLGVPAELADVVTSAQASARMLQEQLEPGSKVLIVGTAALADEVRAVGLEPVDHLADGPTAVVQGYDPQMTWPRLDEAALAVQGGARWFATNTDSTRPTDQGLVPGAGTQIAAIGATTRVVPQVAGKPSTPLLEETLRRMGTTKAIFVGDRLDTDVEGAVAAGIDSLFVFTGAHGKADLVAAGEQARPTHIGHDLRALLEEPRVAHVEGEHATCGDQSASLDGTEVHIDTEPSTREEQLDALRAVLALVWSHEGSTCPDLDRLDAVR